MSEPHSPPATGSRAALVVLAVLVCLLPWAFGGTPPAISSLVAVVSLLTATGIAVARAWRREGLEVPIAGGLAAALFLLGLLQLLPIPPALHWLLAPGSAAIWHPSSSEAARVLGAGARPVSIWPGATLRASAFGLAATALATLALPALRDRRWLLRVAAVVVASGVAVAAYGLVARLAFGDKLYGFLDVPTIAPFGPFVSKNHFAGYCEMAALLALGLASGLARESRRTSGFLGWADSRRAPRVVLASGAAVVLILSVLVSLSRGGVFGMTVGLTAFVLLRSLGGRRTTRWPARLVAAAGALAIAAAAFVVLPPAARERLRSVTAGGRDSSTVFRRQVWLDTARLSARSPIVGYGLGTFVDALPPLKGGGGDMRIEHAEDDYLELLAEGGVTGLLLALGVGWALGLGRRRSAQGDRDRLREELALGSLCGLAALGAHSLVDFNLRIPSNGLLFALLAAVALAGRGAPERSWRYAGALTVVGAALLVSLLSSPLPRGIRVRPSVRRMTTRAHSAPLRLRVAAGEIEDHVRRRPADAEAWVWLGWVRASQGRTREGALLAEHGASLDPQRIALQETARRLAR